MKAVSPVSTERDPVEVVAKAIGLFILLLPATGILMRVVAFSAAGIESPWLLATSAPVSDLATTAAMNAWIVVVGAVLIVSLLRIQGRSRGQPRSIEQLGSLVQSQWRLYISLAAAVTIVAAFLPDWPSSGAAIYEGVAAGSIAPVILGQTGRISVNSLVITALVLMLLYCGLLALGGAGIGSDIATYTFDRAKVGTADGQYARLGESGSITYLQSCASHELIGVASGAIATIKPTKAKQPSDRASLVDVVFSHKSLSLGYQVRC